MMRIGTRTAAAVGTGVLLLAMTGTAQAAPPTRSCPQGGPFVLYTTQQLTELAVSVYGADAPAAVAFLLDAYDQNGDGSLCVQDLTGTDDRVDHYNAVDNAAR
jgi:hypothetical protein